jgi:hypothetical protein
MHLLLVLLCLQELSELQKQIARIGDKDPAASFDAISRLVDLAAKEEVAAAAAKLPDALAFYRTALQEELKARERMKEKFGEVTRVSIDAKEKTLASVIEELAEKTKEKLDAHWVLQSRGSQPVTVKVDDVTALEAIRVVCAEARLRASPQWGLIQLFDGGVAGGGPCFHYRNFQLSAWSVQKTRDVEFGGEKTRTLNVQLQSMLDRTLLIAGIEKADVLECVDDKGRAIPPVDEPKTTPVAAATDSAVVANLLQWSWAPTIRLQWPADDAEKIARLRGSVTLLAVDATASVLLKEKGAKAEDPLFTASLEGVRAERNRVEAVVRITPKSMAEFRKQTIAFRVKIKDGDQRYCFGSGRISEGSVDYSVSPRLTGEESSGRKVLEVESVEVILVKSTMGRKLFYEFRDVPLK